MLGTVANEETTMFPEMSLENPPLHPRSPSAVPGTTRARGFRLGGFWSGVVGAGVAGSEPAEAAISD
jgi:hypothetical protein